MINGKLCFSFFFNSLVVNKTLLRAKQQIRFVRRQTLVSTSVI